MTRLQLPEPCMISYSERVFRSCRFPPKKNTTFSSLSLCGDETLVLLRKGLAFKLSLYYILSVNCFAIIVCVASFLRKLAG